jgi:hypothetical protein
VLGGIGGKRLFEFEGNGRDNHWIVSHTERGYRSENGLMLPSRLLVFHLLVIVRYV